MSIMTGGNCPGEARSHVRLNFDDPNPAGTAPEAGDLLVEECLKPEKGDRQSGATSLHTR